MRENAIAPLVTSVRWCSDVSVKARGLGDVNVPGAFFRVTAESDAKAQEVEFQVDSAGLATLLSAVKAVDAALGVHN